MNLKEIVKQCSSKYSNLKFVSSYELNDCGTVTIAGGGGIWRDYLSDILDVIDAISEESSNVWVVNMDCSLDNSFQITLGFDLNNDNDNA